jgi:predicted nucleotidyltransferase
MDEQALSDLADRLIQVPGVVAVVLGGSRARGTHRPDSDVDLGLYYRGELGVADLRRLAEEATGTPTDVTPPGGWGPWVNGGGWLTIDGWRVDWIYRDLDRVHQVVRDCQAGNFEVGVQPGHPLGFYSHSYAGEIAFCKVLADPTGEIADLKRQLTPYPPDLRTSLINALWEADFSVALARYGAAGHDPAYSAACLFRAIGVACHALHAAEGAWLINEKGMVASAGRLARAPEDFATRAQGLFAQIGAADTDITQTVEAAERLIAEVRASCQV